MVNEDRGLISSCCMPLASINNCATPAQASMVAPFTGLKSISAFPVTRKVNDITSISSNGGKVSCMQEIFVMLSNNELLLFCSVLCEDEKQAVAVKSQLHSLPDLCTKNPPIHGALIVSTILSSPDLKSLWLKEVKVNVDTNVSRVLSIVVGTESMSAFPVITCFLSDLKILNSGLGRLASSSSFISDICSVVSIVIFKISFMLKGEKAFANTLGSITSGAFLLAILCVFGPPKDYGSSKRLQKENGRREIYLCSFIMLLSVYICHRSSGQGYVMTPFIFGLAIPYGPPLGSALEEKFDCFISVLLMPILSCFIGKTIGDDDTWQKRMVPSGNLIDFGLGRVNRGGSLIGKAAEG
ncbi:hypothetical protein IFM89_025036 [Coptis chinensis]|uniref:Cation/H+ exchanger domain-containing protein n=1 Tax=Coptis chinensis TaxID=261450 RepID=A0A835LSD0_9MAGN|nr:hypothetical protein IFM89_025036 [Coptis chinensis]